MSGVEDEEEKKSLAGSKAAPVVVGATYVNTSGLLNDEGAAEGRGESPAVVPEDLALGVREGAYPQGVSTRSIVDQKMAIKARRLGLPQDFVVEGAPNDNERTEAQTLPTNVAETMLPSDVSPLPYPYDAASSGEDEEEKEEEGRVSLLVSEKLAIATRRCERISIASTLGEDGNGSVNALASEKRASTSRKSETESTFTLSEKDEVEETPSDVEATSITFHEGSDDGKNYTDQDSSAGLDESCLIKAELVDERATVHAEVVSEEQLALNLKRRRQWMCGGIVSVFITAVAVTLLVVFLSPNGEEEPLSNYDSLKNLLIPLSGDALLNETTPQHEAFQWLAFDDPAKLNATSTDPQVLIDRYVLALLFLVTDGPAWTNDFGFLTNSSVCDWQVPLSESTWFSQGVGCNSIGIVNQIGLCKC